MLKNGEVIAYSSGSSVVQQRDEENQKNKTKM